ncbi:hypothetical protein [Brevibacillus sp. SYSU BS000544]|uniref:hypothetical protein n=1 Tax=Brevibacillus sp. SYSU BS000544 TaxID=3416443 RepID=UPI003CE5793D
MRVKFRGNTRVRVSRRTPNRNRINTLRLVRVLRRAVANQIQASGSVYAEQLINAVRQTIQNEFSQFSSQITTQLEPWLRNIIQEELNATVPGIVQTQLENELYSARFAQFLQTALSPNSNFGEIAREFLQQIVVLTTTGGTITGILVEIGTDFLRIQESPTSEVLIPFSSAISIASSQ